MMQTKKETGIPKGLNVTALCAVVLVVSLPLMTNYCIDGVNVSFYLRQLERGCEDIFLLAPSLLVKAGLPTEFVYKSLLFVLNIATAAIAYFCFRGIFQDEVTGLIGSMLYTWAPYRLNDLYCRADLGEAISLCFLPMLCYGLYRVFQEETDSDEYKSLWMVLAFGYTVLMQSYLLSFLTAAGFTLLLCIVMWRRTVRKQTLLVLFKTVLAFGVCNLWLPILMLLRIRSGAFSMAAFQGKLIQGGGVYPSVFLQLYFVNGSSWRTDGTGTEQLQPMGVGFAVTLCMMVYLWLSFVERYRGREDEGGIRSFGKGMAVTGAITAVLSMNCFPWDYLQKRNSLFFRMIAGLQSPARLMPIVLLCFTFVSCVAVRQVRRWEEASVGKGFAIAVTVAALMVTQYLTGDILSTGEPRSLYGVEYGTPEGEERYEPGNLDISPWDYGKYESAGSGAPAVIYAAEAVSALASAGMIVTWGWRKRRVEK